MVIILMVVLWLVFGFFALRLLAYDTDEQMTVWIVLWFALVGPIVWLAGMISVNAPHARKRAHFLPALEFNVDRSKQNNIIRRILGVKHEGGNE